MRKLPSILDIVAENARVAGLTVLDVGCGPGDLVRWLAREGARAIGLDTPAMVQKATAFPKLGGEDYVSATGGRLPIIDGCADLVVYSASLHHIEADLLAEALQECRRVLRPGGWVLIIEPAAFPGSYAEIVRLAEDETELQKAAYAAIRAAAGRGFRPLEEEFFYVERSFADYIECMNTFVDDAARREQAIAGARRVTEQRAAEAGVGFDEFRYRSTCRLNLLEKRPG